MPKKWYERDDHFEVENDFPLITYPGVSREENLTE